MTPLVAAIDRATDVIGTVVERHLGTVVAASTATIGATLAVVDGWSTQTIAATGVLGFTLGLVGLTVRTLLTDLEQLRARIKHLEAELDGHHHEISAERTALADRIRELERRLIADDGR